ncbi:hypothetical protein NXV73_07030 [Bacteroides salyersiae]|nr:hypothetical protein [Bacteroides salyersiae]
MEVAQEVTVKEAADLAIRLDSVLLDARTAYPIEVQTTLGGK